MDVNGMMNFCEEMIRSTAYVATGRAHVRFDEHEFDFSLPFERLTMKQAIARYWSSSEYSKTIDIKVDENWLDDPMNVAALKQFINWHDNPESPSLKLMILPRERETAQRRAGISGNSMESDNLILWRAAFAYHAPDEASDIIKTAQNVAHIFEVVAEQHLVNPTFITDFPKPISPLSKASPANPAVAERFELFIAGMECANGFSELNDPKEQYDRFLEQAQARERGDEEAMVQDEDYIRALSYGMPPAAGIGIGIDRLVMLLTNKRSIRDVILFPHMRPERKAEDTKEELNEES
jgi:lysyl-tRNA synthetase class 2